MPDNIPEIIIYTDGAATGNPGPGGYGTVLLSGNYRRELSGGYRMTTNNRMELMAVIAGLEALKIEGSKVSVYSDSRYVVDAIEKGWLRNWLRKGFSKTKNTDLWIRLHKLLQRYQVKFIWVKGHAGIAENERCDKLAVMAASTPNLPPDPGFDSRSNGRLAGL